MHTIFWTFGWAFLIAAFVWLLVWWLLRGGGTHSEATSELSHDRSSKPAQKSAIAASISSETSPSQAHSLEHSKPLTGDSSPSSTRTGLPAVRPVATSTGARVIDIRRGPASSASAESLKTASHANHDEPKSENAKAEISLTSKEAPPISVEEITPAGTAPSYGKPVISPMSAASSETSSITESGSENTPEADSKKTSSESAEAVSAGAKASDSEISDPGDAPTQKTPANDLSVDQTDVPLEDLGVSAAALKIADHGTDSATEPTFDIAAAQDASELIIDNKEANPVQSDSLAEATVQDETSVTDNETSKSEPGTEVDTEADLEIEETTGDDSATTTPLPSIRTATAEQAAAMFRGDLDAGTVRQDDVYGIVYLQRPDEIDDLKEIKGVARVLEGKLHEIGVYRFRQIAVWTDPAVKEFSKLLTNFKNRIYRDDWIAQAKEYHERKYGERLD